MRGKVAAEREAFAISGRTGLPLCSTHPGLILGPRFYKLSESVDELAGRYAYFDSSKAEREIGYTHLSARDTLRRTVAWLIDRGFVAEKRRRLMKLDPSLADAY